MESLWHVPALVGAKGGGSSSVHPEHEPQGRYHGWHASHCDKVLHPSAEQVIVLKPVQGGPFSALETCSCMNRFPVHDDALETVPYEQVSRA